MSFLNGYLLYALPLALLPIVIHLINRQRHRTLPWGAMMFLLDAKRLQRSMAKLRYWLIMAMRMLAIIGLIFAVSRPMSSGWLGASVGNQSDTVLLLLDRSPSMEQIDVVTQRSKRQTAIEKFAALMETTGDGKRIVAIDSVGLQPEEMPISQLASVPNHAAADASADIPKMIQAASEYLAANSVAQADIWIASDLRSADWQAADGRWAALQDSFAAVPGARFHLLSYPERSLQNYAVRVLEARRSEGNGQAELLLQVQITGRAATESETLPVEFEVNGARSVRNVTTEKGTTTTLDHAIPLDPQTVNGWGRVRLPADENAADNTYYFVFGEEPTRRVVIVSDDLASQKPIRVAAMAGPDPTIDYEVSTVSAQQIGEIDWSSASCIIWQANLPEGAVAQQFDAFLNSGRPIFCFPPESPQPVTYRGIRWTQWVKVGKGQPVGVGYWDNESDLLSKTQSGDALPLGKQKTGRYCELVGPVKALSKLTNQANLVAKDLQRPLYFCATLPRTEYSSLAEDGVVLYAMVQRVIAMGAKQQGACQDLATGNASLPETLGSSTLRSTLPEQVVSAEYPYYASCHQVSEGWLSLNRPEAEDSPTLVANERLEKMFNGLDYQVIQDQVGSSNSLSNEIWRVFLLAMAIALVAESALCLT